MRNPITWISPEVTGNKHSKYSKFLKLLSVFPSKPKSTPVLRIDNKYIFNELDHINQLRNRIAHHEPICFASGLPVKSVSYAQIEYQRILKLFGWIGIDGSGFFMGLTKSQKPAEKFSAFDICITPSLPSVSLDGNKERVNWHTLLLTTASGFGPREEKEAVRLSRKWKNKSFRDT